jgi:3-oxoacyl-[acyl-carrier-protein] synthase II
VPKHYRKAVKVMARDIELAVMAASDAVRDAGVVTKAAAAEGETTTFDPTRVGCQIGAGLISADAEELALAMASATDSDGQFSFEAWGESGMNNLTPLWLLKYLPNMLACHVTIIHDARGPSNTITCAEASGTLSIGESMRVIERGAADACFSGGVESKVNPSAMLRFELVGKVAPTGDEASGDAVVKPYDPTSAGALLSEGGGILVLEESSVAAKRGARVRARLTGFGAGHSSRSKVAADRAVGLAGAMRRAIADAGLEAGDIDAVVPGSSGVTSEDATEAAALRAVFGDRVGSLELVTTGASLGCTMAGSGALGVAIAVKMLEEQRLPARVQTGEPEAGLLAGKVEARDHAMKHVLVCAQALGGQNAAVVVSKA